MQLLRHRPAAPLDAFIDCFWYSRGLLPGRRRERALPTGCADLTFNLNPEPVRTFLAADDTVGVTCRDAVVHGPQTRYFVLDGRENVHVIGVHFRVTGGNLLGLPVREISDRHVALADLWGTRAAELRERLLAAPDAAAMFEVLEQAFLRQLRRPLLISPAISFAARWLASKPEAVRIDGIRRQTGYGERHFTSLFADAAGLTPKTFQRVQRLRRVVRYLCDQRRDLADIAQRAGYFDQPHFNHDFRDLTGTTPAEYRPLPGRSAMHSAIAEK